MSGFFPKSRYSFQKINSKVLIDHIKWWGSAHPPPPPVRLCDNSRLFNSQPNICRCLRLKRLFLGDNRLTFEGIPPAIGKLSSLEHFIAPRNNLECIPEGICRMYSLKRLVLTSNCLLTLPEGVHFFKLEVSLAMEYTFTYPTV